MEPQVKEWVDACGGLRPAVHAVMSFSRAFWDFCSEKGNPQDSAENKRVRRDIPIDDLAGLFQATSRDAAGRRGFEWLLQRVQDLGIGWIQKDGRLTLRRHAANPLDLMRSMLKGMRPDHEIRYFVMQNIRQHYGLVQSSAVAHQIHAFSSVINSLIEDRRGASGTLGQMSNWDLHREILPALKSVFPGATSGGVAFFLEACRAVNYVRQSWKPGCIELHAASIDAEYLLSRLFGLPTQIKGLDDLFGGGGIMFVDASEGSVRDRIGGRAVVTVGRFGSGKSLLSLQIAAEVARKGGLAWVMPLEQTAEECLYTMESMGCIRDDAPFSVATTVPEAMRLLDRPVNERDGKGALIFLRTVKDNFEDFLVTFDENVRLMEHYPLRLIVVDPVSAMVQDGPSETADKRGSTDKRARMLRLFETVKQKGTNIWLVAEEGAADDKTSYEQNIADTVIRLSSETRHGYSQRYIEITKSRLQREQRGSHAFTMGPGRGITIYPSSAAVRSILRKRSERTPDTPVKFGLPSLDQILGEKGIYAGDVIVLQGPSGSFKSQVGLSFLLSSDWGEKSIKNQRPLLLSARDNKATIRHTMGQLDDMRKKEKPAPVVRKPEDVSIAVIEGGYVKPGYILQRVEDEFMNSRLNGCPIGRVMIDNIGHWEFSCPYIREDETFGDTLIDMLRRHGVTTVLTCREPRSESESVLQRSVLDNADCLIQFDRIDFRGSSQIMIRILKTRDMTHRRESFELMATPDALAVKTSSSLVRVESDGRPSSVKVRLFLHAESEAQMAYNKTILLAVQSILSQHAKLESENPIHIGRALSMGESSSVDELQILQLDEFQLPAAGRSTPNDLHVFPWSGLGWDIIPRLRERVLTRDGFFALPLYVNVSLLVYRDGLPAACAESWENLSLECARWERDNTAAGDVFFDFPMVSSENYNVLLLEILLWLAGPPQEAKGEDATKAFLEWLTSDMSIQANLIIHRLCRRAFTARHEAGMQDLYQPAPFRVNARARVWRQWYSTLNQMLSHMTAADRADILVTPLPGNISVAGEWFLGVPRYSAAPDVGLRLIQLYTCQEAEMDRLKYGVGLPIRREFYTQGGGSATSISPFLSMDTSRLLQVIEGAFRRSSFGCYRHYASVLSMHLQSILMLSSSDETQLKHEINAKRDGLRKRLAFVGSSDLVRSSSSARTLGARR